MKTLFMLMSLDGKISTGIPPRDFDLDLAGMPGLWQYYSIEQTMDAVSLVTGKTMAKIGVTAWTEPPIPITLVVVDSAPHLGNKELKHLCKKYKNVLVVTSNSSHPAMHTNLRNLDCIVYPSRIDFEDLLNRFDAVTIQSGGELNSVLLRAGLVDKIRLIIAPIIVGGRGTPSVLDGDDIHSLEDLKAVVRLRLVDVRSLENSFVDVTYIVDRDTESL